MLELVWFDGDSCPSLRPGLLVSRDAREAGRRVGPVCRNVAVATTLWNLLEAVSVVDDDEASEGLRSTFG